MITTMPPVKRTSPIASFILGVICCAMFCCILPAAYIGGILGDAPGDRRERKLAEQARRASIQWTPLSDAPRTIASGVDASADFAPAVVRDDGVLYVVYIHVVSVNTREADYEVRASLVDANGQPLATHQSQISLLGVGERRVVRNMWVAAPDSQRVTAFHAAIRQL